MGRSKKYGNITLKPEDRKKLAKLANSQTSEYRSLQKHIRKHCMDAGYPGLSQISPNTVRTILESSKQCLLVQKARLPDISHKFFNVSLWATAFSLKFLFYFLNF